MDLFDHRDVSKGVVKVRIGPRDRLNQAPLGQIAQMRLAHERVELTNPTQAVIPSFERFVRPQPTKAAEVLLDKDPDAARGLRICLFGSAQLVALFWAVITAIGKLVNLPCTPIETFVTDHKDGRATSHLVVGDSTETLD